MARVSESLVRDVGRHAARPNMSVRLDLSEGYVDDEDARPRQGKAYQLPMSKSAFRTAISSRARYMAHSGMLEVHVVTLSFAGC